MSSTSQFQTTYFPLFIIYFSTVLFSIYGNTSTLLQFQKGLAFTCRLNNDKSISHSINQNGVEQHGLRRHFHSSLFGLGVPKVAYRLPGSTSADWIDIYNRLYRERIIFMSQEIDHDFANQLISIMLYLDCEDSTKPIHLYINSPGGSIVSGMAIFDTMKHIRSEIITINVGMAASMASFILAAGTKGKRFALPHSRIMIHQPIGGAEGQAEDIRIEANQILKIKNQIVNLYSRMTGLPKTKILKDIDRDKFMSAEEARDQGFIDHIIQYKDKLYI